MNKWKTTFRLIIAGIFLLILIAIFVLPQINSRGVAGEELKRVGDKGVYDIVTYDIPDEYEVTNLYVATIKPDEELCEVVKKSFYNVNCDYAIHVFRVEDEKDEYKNPGFTFLLFDSKGVYQEVYASENDKGNFGYTSPTDSMFEVLSSLTSPDKPMYVVKADECVYYVIGDTAYVRRNYGWVSYDRLPAVAMPDEDVIVVEIPLGAEG